MGSIAAAVLTHRRPALAARTVAHLVEVEGFDPTCVHVVVNGEGGVDDPPVGLRVHHLADNLGPAGGMRVALELAFADPDVAWAYLCEDDVGGLGLRAPRTAALVEDAAARTVRTGRPVGAVTAYARRLDPRTGTTVPHLPTDAEHGLVATDVAAWGATLVAREVFDAGIVPRDELFFGYEDFDFFLAVTEAGFEVTLDADAARHLGLSPHPSGRDASLGADRTIDDTDPWRRYYEARNLLAVARRHGRAGWYVAHVVKSLRRGQLGGWAHRRAIAAGLLDGVRGRLGRSERYQRRGSDQR